MEFPVMLYLNGLDSHAIAHDTSEMSALKAKGYVVHEEAMKIKPKADTKPNDSKDQLAEAYEHIEMLEGAIEIKDKEILELNGKLEKSDEWNKEVTEQNELHRTTIKELNEKIANSKNSTDDTQEVADLKAKLAIYEETKDVNGDGVVSYDEMTNKELQKLLEQRKVDYAARDGKDALIQKLKDSE